MIRTIEQLINKFIYSFSYLCLFSYDLFDRAACLIYDDSLFASIGSIEITHRSPADMRALLHCWLRRHANRF